MQKTESLSSEADRVLKLMEQIRDLESELVRAQASMDRSLAARLREIGETTDQEEQKRKLDKEIRREFDEMHYKMKRLNPPNGPQPPNPRDQWEVTKELWNLIQKLIQKAFILQGLKPPIPPRPEGPNPS